MYYCSILLGTIINIPADQPTIQEGIDVANEGDTVLVQPGVYEESINMQNGITLFGSGRDTTIITTNNVSLITPASNNEIAFFTLSCNSESSNSMIVNINYYDGLGNIYFHDNNFDYNCRYAFRVYSNENPVSDLIIENNSFTGNAISSYRCYCMTFQNCSNILIYNNTFHNINTNMRIYIIGTHNPISNFEIVSNRFYNISSNEQIVILNIYSQIQIEYNLFFNCYGSMGGDADCIIGCFEPVEIYNNTIYNCPIGIKDFNNYSIIKNNIISNCYNYGIYGLGLSEIDYNDIWGNAVNYGYSSNPGLNDISLNPYFVYPENSDFHLQSISPCIDTGDPNSPFDPDGTIADMGAFYYDQSYCPPIAEFSANPIFGYYPSVEVNFTDESIGNVTNWFWDFQNDGIYNSFEQNPSFIYTDVGIYDVKLKVSDGTQADSLIKYDYITVELVPPSPPTNIQIEITGNDALLSWAEVDTTIFGTPIDVDYYLISGSYDPYQDFVYIGSTADTTYTHERVGLFNDKMFYEVRSFVGTRQELEIYIEECLKREEEQEGNFFPINRD